MGVLSAIGVLVTETQAPFRLGLGQHRASSVSPGPQLPAASLLRWPGFQAWVSSPASPLAVVALPLPPR